MFRPCSPCIRAAALFLWVLPGARLPAAEGKPDAALSMRLLKANCLSCHNEEKRKGGLALHTREALLEGGDGGPALVEGKPEDSALIQSLAAGADPHMPPKKQLSHAQITLLSDWVRGGAPWDAAALSGGASAARAVSLARLPESYRPVMAMALSPDGMRLAAGCGNELLLFDTTVPGGLVFKTRASAHPDAVLSMAWTPDGKSLVTGAFRRVIVWTAESLTPQREIQSGLTDRIGCVLPLPQSGRALVADGLVGESGIVRELDLATGQVARSWPAHDDSIFAMALSRDGTRLATAGGDKLVKIWDTAAGTETARLEAHGSQVLSVAYDPDEARLVTGGADRQLKVWDVKTRENLIALPVKSAAFNALQWSAAGPAVFAVLEDGALLKYTDFKTHTGAQSSETATEARLGTSASALYCLTVSAADGRLFAGSRDAHILAWDKDGKQTDNINALTAGATPQAPPP